LDPSLDAKLVLSVASHRHAFPRDALLLPMRDSQGRQFSCSLPHGEHAEAATSVLEPADPWLLLRELGEKGWSWRGDGGLCIFAVQQANARFLRRGGVRVPHHGLVDLRAVFWPNNAPVSLGAQQGPE